MQHFTTNIQSAFGTEWRAKCTLMHSTFGGQKVEFTGVHFAQIRVCSVQKISSIKYIC